MDFNRMTGFLARWGLAFGLLCASYNPTRWNYTSWAIENYTVETPIVLLLGLLLIAGYIIYVRATLKSIGPIGIGLVAAIVAAAVWTLKDQGILSLDSTAIQIWIALIGLSFVLGIGLSWSHIRRAISGQFDIGDGGD